MNKLTQLPKIYTNLHIGGSYDGEVFEHEREGKFHVLPKIVPRSHGIIGSEFSPHFIEEYREMIFRACNSFFVLEVLSELSDSDVMEMLIDRYKKEK